MLVRFKGEADGLPCHVFGLEFPVGEWVEVEGAAAAKLAGNPMFESDNADADADPEPELNVEDLRAQLDARGISYHPRAGAAKLAAALAEAGDPGPEPDPEEQDA